MISIITATHQRAEKLQQLCLPSLLAQTNLNFEWVVINDGACAVTREIVKEASAQLNVRYFESKHQGLIASRNLGLEQASGDLIAFLDDDNRLEATFIATMQAFFDAHLEVQMCCPTRLQRRDVYKNGERIKEGKTFFRPRKNATDTDFIQNQSRAWFDSNGFTHRKNKQIRFNPNLLIMSDYEYLLQCYSEWGQGSMAILEEQLVWYVQTNEGIIGQSNFKDWLKEFEWLAQHQNEYAIFQQVPTQPWLDNQIQDLRTKVAQQTQLPGFDNV